MLKFQELKAKRQKLAIEMRAYHTANEKTWSPENESAWKRMNADYDAAKTAEDLASRQSQNVHGLGREDTGPGDWERNGGGPDLLTRAVGAWALNSMGRPVSEDEADACRSYGTALSSAVFEIKLQPSIPALGRDRFGQRSETRALGTQIGSAGGFTVGDNQSFLSRLEGAMLRSGGMLQESEVIVTPDGAPLPWPTTDDTSNEGSQIGENTDVGTDTDPSFKAQIFNAYKVKSGIIKASTEILRDSAVGMANVIADLLGKRIGRFINRRCTVGTGAATATGIVTSATSGVTAALTTALTSDELMSLMHSVDADYRTSEDNCGWMFHDSVAAYIRKWKDANGQYLWQQSAQLGQPDMLFGWPVSINNHMSSAFTTGQKLVLFGARKKYKVRLVGSLRLRRLVERYAEYDQDGFIAFQEFDGALLDAGTHPVKYLALA